MAETAQAYIDRILSTLGGEDPLLVLEKTPHLLGELIGKFSAGDLNRRPAPGKWSAAQIAIHLSEVEMVVGVRVRVVLGSNGAAILGFDQDAWAERYDKADVKIALAAFNALRAANLTVYRSLTPAQWQHYGMHSERGKETARRIVELCAGHDINHLRQLEDLVG